MAIYKVVNVHGERFLKTRLRQDGDDEQRRRLGPELKIETRPDDDL